jgi:AcrR family transcriptional regulator
MPKIVDHDAYREELLAKCFNLFSRKGFHNVSMREICKEVGVSTGTMYHHFPSKERILEHMLPWAVESNVGAFASETKTDLSVQERLDELATFWIEREDYYKNLILLVIDLFRNGSENSEEVFSYIIDTYKIGLSKSLGIGPKLSKVIYIYLLGLAFNSLLTPKTFPYKDEILFLQDALGSVLEEGDQGAVEFLKKMQE